MLKEKIISLLAGDNLQDYLEGMELLTHNIRQGNLAELDLDQEIMERACAVLILEKWIEHEDYFATLGNFMNELPNYQHLLNHSDVGHWLRGIAIFINGLAQGDQDVSGFAYASHSGWLMSSSAAEQLVEYFMEQQDQKAVDFFNSIESFFGRINSEQFGIISAMMNIPTWNDGMADGFYNIMTSSDISTQSWMLGSLYKVIEEDAVKNKIFGRYLGVLHKVKDKYKSENNSNAEKQVDAIIEMVVEKSKGN